MRCQRREMARALCVLVLAFPVCVVDALLLTSPAQETRSDLLRPPVPGAIPSGKSIGIMLRGETFRYIHLDADGAEHRKPCAEEGKSVQMRAMHSFIDSFITPLEQKGNRVEVFFTTMTALGSRYQTLHKANSNGTLSEPGCALDYLLIDALKENSTRVVKERFFEATGQADSFLKAVNAFNQEYGGSVEGVRAHFDYVLIVRSDMVWLKTIDAIKEAFDPNFDNINVISRCEPMTRWENGGEHCVHDTFWMMPTYLYPSFVSCLGHDGCFDPANDPRGRGHVCQIYMREAIANAGHPDAFGWLEPGQVRVRGHSEVARIIGRLP